MGPGSSAARRGLLCVLAAWLLAGCGGASGSCATSVGATEVCTDYQQAYTPSTAQLACSGIYSTAACPTANRVGRCAVSVTVLGSTASTTLSYYAPTTTDIAMLACTSAGGTFRSN